MPKEAKIEKAYWHTPTAGKKGAINRFKKYGRVALDEEHRLNAWRKWWVHEGQYKHNFYFKVRNIKTPLKNEKLAEFVGIMIGDGGITARQTIITLNYRDDKEYIGFVIKLIHTLFGVEPSRIRQHKHSVDSLVVSRTELVRFCLSLGLAQGNKLKNGLDMPLWVRANRKFSAACVRGIMDTDGCIFNECHKIKNGQYCYPRLSIVSASPVLLHSIYTFLRNEGFSPRIRNNRSVNLEIRADIARYFKEIGTHNPKHARRWKQFGGVG